MRLIDRMCPAHVAACRTRWTPAGDCPLCRQRSKGQPDPKILPDLTRDGPDRVNAIHEAGHAVVALALDIPVVSVKIWTDGERGKRPDGGYTETVSLRLVSWSMRSGRRSSRLPMLWWSGDGCLSTRCRRFLAPTTVLVERTGSPTGCSAAAAAFICRTCRGSGGTARSYSRPLRKRPRL